MQDEVDRIAKELELALLLGATSIRHDVTGGIPGPARATTGFEQVADRLAAALSRPKPKGIATMVENHGFFFQDVDRVESLVTRVGAIRILGCCSIWATSCAGTWSPRPPWGGWPPLCGMSTPRTSLSRRGAAPEPGRGFFRSRGGRYLRGTIIGHGDVPVAACLGILKEAGYAGAWASSSRGWRTAWRASPSAGKPAPLSRIKANDFGKRPLSREG